MKKYNVKSFIIKANKVHNNLYNYDLIVEEDLSKKIIIICKNHGEFKQSTGSHLKGNGCKLCANENMTNPSVFFEKAKITHDNKYDYSKSIYVNMKTKIEVICAKHDSFYISPDNHINSKLGCKICSNIKKSSSANYWINKCILIHKNKYDYSKSIYTNAKSKIIIICPVHKEFEQIAGTHISGKGCIKCTTHISKKEIAWLNYLKVPIKCRQKNLTINNKVFKFDAINKCKKIIYEFYGDYWHGNPLTFNLKDINKHNKKTFQELYNKTINREQLLIKAGYKIISIWESEWNLIYKNLYNII